MNTKPFLAVVLLLIGFVFSIQIPEQIRISLTENVPLTYSIMWQSNETNSNPSLLRWGYKKENLNFTVT